MTPASEILHGSCVSVEGRGLLILGAAGSGKSTLALGLIARGALLVADDRTEVSVQNDRLVARCPASIRGLIEARGIGLLRAPTVDQAEITLVVDLGRPEEHRLPPRRRITILGCETDLVLHPQNDHLPDSLMLYLRHGRQA